LLIDFQQLYYKLFLESYYYPCTTIISSFWNIIIVTTILYFKFSYNTGLETSMKESKYKYKVAGWLQEIARNNFSFEIIYITISLNKNDMLVSDYLNYREHFSVIKTQFSQLIIFKIIITASLLSIGGYLVLSNK
jgi:hypothetical protein